MAQNLATQMVTGTEPESAQPVIANPLTSPNLFRESNYNPKVTLGMLENIFGYSRQTFINWEKEAEEAEASGKTITTPKIKATIEKHPKFSRLNKRLYTVEDVRKLWQYFRSSGKLPSPASLPTSIAVWSNKGGVGKSFLSKELASILSILMGYKVLLVDCDLQADCTLLFNCDQKFEGLAPENISLQPTIRDIVGWEDVNGAKYKAKIDEAIIPLSPTLSIIPSDDDLAYIDLDLRFHDEETRLKNIEAFTQDLRTRFDYDIVIFDCPPNIGEFVHNVLFAADRLLVPVEIEAKCLHTISRVVRHLNLIGEHHENYRFEKIVAVPNKFQAFQTLHQQALTRLKELFGNDILSRTSLLQQVAAVGKSDERKQALFMGPFSSDKEFNIPIVKRFSNAMWNLAHEILDVKPHKELFSDSPVDE